MTKSQYDLIVAAVYDGKKLLESIKKQKTSLPAEYIRGMNFGIDLGTRALDMYADFLKGIGHSIIDDPERQN
ncbi:MAG: hypothetical protein BV456_10320 [Thermoplasmata archaeon M8B2D]|nr:MAG: hypothetical protein BV456_10320 [Thermoplasmata archaeon M8B2D]